MNEKFDLLTEKYTSTLCGIVAFVVFIFTIKYNNPVVLAWLDNTRWFLFGSGVLNFIYFPIFVKNAVKASTFDYDIDMFYPALQLLEQHPQEKKRFYRHFDKITYSSLLVAIITMFYPNLCNFYQYHTIYISITMGLTAYMFSQIVIVYVILDKFKKYSRKARKQSK
jgi:hypothetical protein